MRQAFAPLGSGGTRKNVAVAVCVRPWISGASDNTVGFVSSVESCRKDASRFESQVMGTARMRNVLPRSDRFVSFDVSGLLYWSIWT
jgi:hypothetical protein